jgi:hypothetical protein
MDRIRDRLLSFLEWLRQELTKLFQVGKLKVDATSLQRERGAVYQELRKKAHELLKQGQLQSEELKPTAERIDLLTKRIEERREALENLVRTRNDGLSKPGEN